MISFKIVTEHCFVKGFKTEEKKQACSAYKGIVENKPASLLVVSS